MTTNTSRNFEIWVKKKKMQVELKKENLGWERENADQLCCQLMSSLNQDETSIQSSSLLATKYLQIFSSPLLDL